jgi:hypothetical protein
MEFFALFLMVGNVMVVVLQHLLSLTTFISFSLQDLEVKVDWIQE